MTFPLAARSGGRHTRGMRKYENDYLLWAAISTPLFCAALAYENFGPGGGGRRNWTDGIGFWVIAAGVVGWALHGVAVVCGLRLAVTP